MSKPTRYQPGQLETAVRVLAEHGFGAMEAYLAACEAGIAPPENFAALAKPCAVYLAFFGESATSTHLKIGIADDVASRFRVYQTNCPLPRRHALVAQMPTRAGAVALEAHLLSMVAETRVHGEWARIGDADETADALTSAASQFCGRHIEFKAY